MHARAAPGAWPYRRDCTAAHACTALQAGAPPSLHCPVLRMFGVVQFCGHVKLPLSTAEYAVEDGTNTFAVGEGPLQLHVEQSNLIFQL